MQCDLKACTSYVNLGICFIFRKADSAETFVEAFPAGIVDYTGTAEMSCCQDKQLRKTNRKGWKKQHQETSRQG